MKMEKICVFVGSRANYSSARTIMREVLMHPEMELQVLLGASAMLERFGNLEQTIENDGFEITEKFYMIVEGENPTTMAKSTGLGIIDMTSILSNLEPDVVVVIGDRYEIMSVVIAAAYMNIPIAHTMGGERTGTIDESIRHAITKFAHIHFPANEDAKERIIKMGEDPNTVYNVGCPRMDYIKEVLTNIKDNVRYTSEEIFAKYKGVGGDFNLDSEDFILVSYHPVTTEFGMNRHYAEELLAALQEINMPTIMLWPNADAGSDEISKAVRVYREKYHPEWLHMFINLPIDVYVQLMSMTSCMVGNSSSAIREGEIIGVPSVNIGSRQNMRVRGENIVDVKPLKDEIKNAIIDQVNHEHFKSKYLYGNGTAGKQIVDVLEDVQVEIQKCNFY
jgi:UDP-hydrolysing UDP-N-acetyl-D-glucosamine 2-epimerase